MAKLTAKEVKELIDRVGPSLGYDFTYEPVFPKDREDICAVRRLTENGSTYGFDTIYLVWKESDGSLKYKEIKNSRATKDYIHIDSVGANKDGGVSVKFGSGGSYSGVPWSESMRVAIQNNKVKVTEKSAKSFKEKVKQAMAKVVESHQHHHPLYLSTYVKEYVIDEKKGMAAFILFEQIDTDRLSEHGEGWLGDQFRYSLWVMKAGRKPQQIYEDHAYIRPYTKSELTGTRGRDCTLKNLRLEGKTIKVLHPEGKRVEDQEWKELVFSL